MITREMVGFIACPACRAPELRLEAGREEEGRILDGRLACAACSASYEIGEEVPDLIPPDVLSSGEWKLWRDHLDGFAARRQWRAEHEDRFEARITNRASRLQVAFGSFTGITSGRVLDIGCGPGNIRRQFDPEKVEYVGVDPLPLDEARDFLFARAVAEFLPFRDGAFSDVLVMAAMDHFRDLDVFFDEVDRVLRPGGRLHLVQSIHEVRGPVTAIKLAAHWIKDRREAGLTRGDKDDVPKHLSEFKRSTLHELLERRYEIVAEESFSKRWYSPENLFVSLVARAEQPAPK